MTCNTGFHRRSGGSSLKRPAHRKMSHTESFYEETDQVWTEAGFLPPADYRRAVALLHRLAMAEEPAASLVSCVLTGAARTGDAGHNYRILDSIKLRRTAEEYGIDTTERDDCEIAHAVTTAIIAEYGEKTPEERA
ncbi:hypothetical protein [Methanoculleus sp.]|uniref:hypothetical protein n=1 Tax=Methanoculleus sp. TaxID=90427 RepID=UPI0025F86318|nr:hypothetical protein [Methanoculleus sp.]